MGVRLSGIPVAREMRGRIQAGVEQLHQIGQIPTMGIVRVGARPEDISYETGAPMTPPERLRQTRGPCRLPARRALPVQF